MSSSTPSSTAPTPTQAAFAGSALSVNRSARPLVQRLVHEAERLRVAVATHPSGVRIVDAGVAVPGSVEAGLLIGAICMGGLGHVALRSALAPVADGWPTWLQVASGQPVLACLASQYAGWSLAASKEETGGKKFFSLGSGPARALACKEELFKELGYRDPLAALDKAAGGADEPSGVLVLEVDQPPPQVVIDKVLKDCGLAASQLTFVLTPTKSLAGTTQVVARVLEVALHKAHELHFPLEQILDGSASAPLPPPAGDGLEAMGRTNDAILYGGRVQLVVDCPDDAARQLAQQLPSLNSRDYGRGFAEIFKAAEYDFYKIDGALFAPAEVWVSSVQSGRTWHGGKLNLGLLRSQWLAEA